MLASSPPRRDRRSGRRRISLVKAAALAVTAASIAAACSSGESALEIDSGGAETTAAPDVTTGSTTGDTDVESPDDTAPAPNTTQAPLAEFPECPTDALAEADGVVEITFWHAMNDVLEDALIELTDAYNASQDAVRVTLQNQIGYDEALDKYIQSSGDSRPDMIQIPEFTLQSFAQSDTLIPVGGCIEASGFDTSSLLERALDTYAFEGVIWSMPFNVSNPVLYYLRPKFEAAGLDPDVSPITLEELRATSQQVVDSGAATYGWVLDSGPNSGGAWFLEQWFARAPISSMRTTRTAGAPRPPRCCSTDRPVSNC